MYFFGCAIGGREIMKRELVLGLLLVCGSIIIAGIVFVTQNEYVKEEIVIEVTVGDYAGIDVDTEKLTFGTIKPGMISERTIKLESDQPEEVTLTIEGISFVSVSQEKMVVTPGNPVVVTVKAEPPKEADKNTYVGKLIMLSKAL